MSSSRRGQPPKHQNTYAWKPNAGRKINETEVGGKFRPYSEITGVCSRCKDQIEWKRNQRCSKRTVRQAHHNLCPACAKEQNVCAKCSCQVGRIIGRDSSEVEAEQKTLEEAIKNARERDRRTLLRAMNKGKTNSAKTPVNNESKAGELLAVSSLEKFTELSRHEEEEEDDDDEEEEEEDEDQIIN